MGEPRVASLRWVLCVAIGCAQLGCGRPAEPALAPELLFDAEEIGAYLDEFPAGDYEIVEVPGLGRFYVDDNPALVKQALRAGEPWEPYVIEAIERHVGPGDTVLDIGAHIGSLTVAMARRVGPQGRVYAFEPQRKVYRELVHNLRLNGLEQAVPLRFALSSEASILEMDPPAEYDGRVRVGQGGDRVEARTLDSFAFPDVDLMKLDVEGHELAVLRGAARTIDAFLPAIVIEIWQPNLPIVVATLEGYGYSVRRIAGSHYDYLATHPARR